MGWLKTACYVGALVGAFYVGKLWGTARNEGMPYSVAKRSGNYVLVEKATGHSQPIGKNFQLGNIDHRVNGILEDMKTDMPAVQQAITDNFGRHYQPKEESKEAQ